MDRAEYIHKKKGRYMAQVLEAFERDLQPVLEAAGVNGEVQSFKGLVRARMNALATDAVDVIQLDTEAQNGLTLELRDRLSPTGQT